MPGAELAEDSRPLDVEGDFLRLKDVDHIEFWVGDAFQAAYFWQQAVGFKPVAYSGLETGNRERPSIMLEQGNIRLVLTGTYSPNGIAAHHITHGNGVKVVAFEVDDVDEAWNATTERGALGIQPPTEESDEHGVIRFATIATYGDTVHKLVDRSRYSGPFMPGYKARQPLVEVEPVGLTHVDHIVGNVQLGKMETWVRWYHRVMGFRQMQSFAQDVSTEYSALMSRVMEAGAGRIKLPINEPAEGKRKSQIEEYLDYYLAPGVQHIAMSSDNIIETVGEMRRRGVRFLRVPETYYDALPGRVGDINEDLGAIRELGILVDKDDEGYLLQVFTSPLQDRPTFFMEVIQRHGSRGFGVGNFRALFQAIEAAQQARGNF